MFFNNITLLVLFFRLLKLALLKAETSVDSGAANATWMWIDHFLASPYATIDEKYRDIANHLVLEDPHQLELATQKQSNCASWKAEHNQSISAPSFAKTVN